MNNDWECICMNSTCEPHLNNHPDELSFPEGFCLPKPTWPNKLQAERKCEDSVQCWYKSLPKSSTCHLLPTCWLGQSKKSLQRKVTLMHVFSYRYKTPNSVGSAAMFSSIISWDLLEFPACHERVWILLVWCNLFGNIMYLEKYMHAINPGLHQVCN